MKFIPLFLLCNEATKRNHKLEVYHMTACGKFNLLQAFLWYSCGARKQKGTCNESSLAEVGQASETNLVLERDW